MGGGRERGSLVVVVLVVVVVVWCGLVGVASGVDSFESEEEECGEALVGMSTCLAYVEGGARTPTPDCCEGLKGVMGKTPKCLCILIKDRDDPRLGLKLDPARAVALPAACSVPANISHCPDLLKLDPNSKDAEFFKQLASKQGNNNATSSNENGVPSSSSSSSPAVGGKTKDSSAGSRSCYVGVGRSVGGLWASCVLALCLVIPVG